MQDSKRKCRAGDTGKCSLWMTQSSVVEKKSRARKGDDVFQGYEVKEGALILNRGEG